MTTFKGPGGQSKPRPRICFLALSAYPILAGRDDISIVGGAELQQVLVARGLARRGYPVSMISLDFGQPAREVIDGIVVFRTYRLDAGLPGLRFFWPRLASVWRCMALADADIYYQRAAGVLTGIMAAYARLHRRRSIFAAAGDPMIHRRQDYWLYEYGVRSVDAVFVQNIQQQSHFQRAYGRDPLILPNCYARPPRAQPAPGREILWVSTIRAIKGPEIFLQLARSLPDYRFRMIGGPGAGEHGLFEAIQRQAGELTNLEFMGFQPLQEVEKHFNRAAVFVNTSTTEGFPNTFLQSWSRGIPTVSFVDSGARLRGLTPGQVVGTLDDMVATVSFWMNVEAARGREGQLCQEYFESHHSIEDALDLYEKAFDDLQRS